MRSLALLLASVAPVSAQTILYQSPSYVQQSDLTAEVAARNAAIAISQAAAIAGAPVQAVNGNVGQVLIPTVQRIVSKPLDITGGSVTWTFADPANLAQGVAANFANAPTCYASVSQADTTYVFSAPSTPASTSSVTASLRAAKVSLNLLGLGLLTLWTNPPAGTTLTLSCVGALP